MKQLKTSFLSLALLMLAVPTIKGMETNPDEQLNLDDSNEPMDTPDENSDSNPEAKESFLTKIKNAGSSSTEWTKKSIKKFGKTVKKSKLNNKIQITNLIIVKTNYLILGK